MKKTAISILLLNFLIVVSSTGQRLERFGAETGMEERNGIVHRSGYSGLVNYYGYIKHGASPDDMRNGKPVFYLYFYLNDTLPEIGVRLITPVPEVVFPDKGDIVSENYLQNENEKSGTFNSWIILERAYSIKSFADIATKLDKTGWLRLDQNDDADELLNKTNSLLRIKATDKQFIPPGLYRVGISTLKNDEVKGGFLLQLGATIALPGVKLSPKAADLK